MAGGRNSLHMFLYSAYQTMFQVTRSQWKQMKMFQESKKKKKKGVQLHWISLNFCSWLHVTGSYLS